jgi:hypothetical protein
MAKQEAIGLAVQSMIKALLSDGPRILATKTPAGESRLQAPGNTPPPDPKPGSPHHEGRALDIVLFNNTPERLIADDLIRRFILHRGALEWQYMAYNQKSWNASGVQSPLIWTKEKGEATGMPAAFIYEHHTHIHIQWPQEKKSNDYSTETVAALGGERDVEVNLGALLGWWDVNDGKQYYYYFGTGGFVQWTSDKPKNTAKTAKPVEKFSNKGSYTVTSDGVLTITWNPAGGGTTVEIFKTVSETVTAMKGESKRYEAFPLTAKKMV